MESSHSRREALEGSPRLDTEDMGHWEWAEGG